MINPPYGLRRRKAMSEVPSLSWKLGVLNFFNLNDFPNLLQSVVRLKNVSLLLFDLTGQACYFLQNFLPIQRQSLHIPSESIQLLFV